MPALLAPVLAAQVAPTASGAETRTKMARALVEAALEGRAHDTLAELTRTAPRRLSGSEGAARAVQWAVAALRRLELDAVRTEPVMVPRWERGEAARLTLVDAPDVVLPILALGGSIATPEGGLEAELAVAKGLADLRASPERFRGKIVLLNRAMPRALANTFRAYGQAVPQRTNGATEAAKVGAVAVVVRSLTTRRDDVPHTGAVVYADGVDPVPAAAVSTLGAERLAQRSAVGPVRVRLALDCRTLPDVESANVVGEIRGATAPDEVVLIGAHLDAWDVGQGAHDDGAGCAHLLEALRLLRALEVRPARTIRAVLYINEENGLRGGRGYAARHAADLAQHVAALETDAGGFMPKGFQTTADPALRARVKDWLQPLRAYGMGAVVPGGGGADISPLREHGVPLFGLVVTSHRYFDVHHSARDVLGAVHERELAMGAAAVAYWAYCLATF